MISPSDIDRQALQQIESLPGFSFWKRQLELLGGQDPSTILKSTPEELAGLLERLPHRLFRRQALPGKWTPNQILGHLADVEWIFGYRLRTIRADQTPLLQGADQEKWVEEQDWNSQAPERLLQTFSALRQVNLDFWDSLSPDDFDKAGRHAEADVLLSIRLLQRILAGHDLSHLGQIKGYLDMISRGLPLSQSRQRSPRDS